MIRIVIEIREFYIVPEATAQPSPTPLLDEPKRTKNDKAIKRQRRRYGKSTAAIHGDNAAAGPSLPDANDDADEADDANDNTNETDINDDDTASPAELEGAVATGESGEAAASTAAADEGDHDKAHPAAAKNDDDNNLEDSALDANDEATGDILMAGRSQASAAKDFVQAGAKNGNDKHDNNDAKSVMKLANPVPTGVLASDSDFIDLTYASDADVDMEIQLKVNLNELSKDKQFNKNTPGEKKAFFSQKKAEAVHEQVLQRRWKCEEEQKSEIAKLTAVWAAKTGRAEQALKKRLNDKWDALLPDTNTEPQKQARKRNR